MPLMPIVFLVLGLFSIFIEFFLPGGIFAVIGALLVLGSIIAFAALAESLWFSLIFLIFAALSVYIVIKLALFCIRKGFLSTSIYSEDNQEGYVASSWNQSLVGKEGIVLTELRPGGHVRIEKESFTAISKSRFIEKGEEIVVVGGEGETLFVIPKRPEKES